MKGFPDLPPVWWAASIAVIYGAKSAMPEWHFETKLFDLVSKILFFVALAIIGWSSIWFWRKRTPIEPNHTPKSLIVEGPYRLSRNPIYLALVILTISSSLGHGSVIGLLAALGLWTILDRRYARKEEALLHNEFGEAASHYFGQTRRWL